MKTETPFDIMWRSVHLEFDADAALKRGDMSAYRIFMAQAKRYKRRYAKICAHRRDLFDGY